MTTQKQIAPAILSFQSHSVRTLVENGELLFNAKDVCDVLGYQNSRKAIADHCKAGGVTNRYPPTDGGNQEMAYINEPNLYRLIIKSRKPEAEAFEAWVMEEVLPTIRKTGGYRAPKTRKTSPGGLTLEQVETIKALHRELVKAAPKDQQARLAITLWSAVKSKFGVSYKDVPPEHYAEILSLMSRIAIEGELLPPPEPQEPEIPDYIVMLPIDIRRNTRFEIVVHDGLVGRYYREYVTDSCDYGKPWGTLLKAGY